MRLFNRDGQEIAADLYAKVLTTTAAPGCFQVGFTSVPPEIETFLNACRDSAS